MIGLLLWGCAEAETGRPRIPAAPTPMPTITVQAAASAAPPLPLQTYRDEAYGFTFDYPAGWMLEPVSLGDRSPTAYQLTSWVHAPGMVSAVPAGGTIMTIGIQHWDPKSDLDAFVAQRKSAWRASGLTIANEEEVILANGSRALAGMVTEPGEGQGYFLFTLVGEDYLFATGDGEVLLLASVARSLR